MATTHSTVMPFTRTAVGVGCGMAAGALWGLVFLAPELVSMFSPLQLTIGRYLAYGLISAALIAPRWPTLRQSIGRKEWLALGWLALAGNTLYYILLSSAVQLGGIAMTSLVIGFLPVVVTVVGSREHGAVPLGRLWPSLLLCVAAAICIGWQAIMLRPVGAGAQAIGFICAIGALAAWTCFAIGNARWLARLDTVSVHDWNLLTGLVTGVQACLLIPVAIVAGVGDHMASDWAKLAMVSVGVAVLASIAGNALWNRMSRLLPLTLVGQMVLFETLFALLYGFLWEQRVPTSLETGAMTLVILGVLACLAAHRPASAAQ